MLNILSQKEDLRSLKNISGLSLSPSSNINFHIIEDASKSYCSQLLKKEKEEIFLDNLREGDFMFWMCSGTKIIKCYAPKLINAPHMFAQVNDFENTIFSSIPIEEFYGDLSSLKNGEFMFYGSNLKEFRGNLSSLENGAYMFSRCIEWENFPYIGPEHIPDLSPLSVLTIVETLPTYDSTHYIDISIQIDDTTEAKDNFAKEASFDTWEKLNEAFDNKGWLVRWNLGKVSSSNTLDLNEETHPLKWYVKLSEIKINPIMKKYAEKQNKLYIPLKANYCSEDGEKFYKLEWCNDSNNLEGYQEFGSLLEACGYYGIIPVKYLEKN